MRYSFRFGLSAALLLLAGLAEAAPFVVNSAGTRVEGTAIRSGEDGTVWLTIPQGQTLAFRPGMYRQAMADRPPELAQVAGLARQKKLDEAADLLRRVKQQYRFLGWDRRASQMLARVELARKNFAAAAAEYEELFAAEPGLKAHAAERERYMQALFGAGRTDRAAAMIDEEIASGSREAAARAQLVRGDMKAASGRFEEALLDYLRTVILFRKQTALLPEATYKTAAALKALNDPRAAAWFQRAVEEFPGSDFAERAKGERP